MNPHPTWNDISKTRVHKKRKYPNPKRSLFSHNAGASHRDAIATCEKCWSRFAVKDLNAHWRECVSTESK